jgi:crossover junction endodeoxyribonuclease RuvC
MIILGVDPGIGRCGWGVIETVAGKSKVIDYGCIETTPNGKIEERLVIISSEINNFIKKYNPDYLSIEELFFGSNSKTALTVGQARGVILLSAGENKIPTAVYTPLQVKIALTGYGRADKNQIAQMVKLLLKLPSIPKIDDITDALAIALTHAFSAKMGKLES